MATSTANAERELEPSISVAAPTGDAASPTTLANEASASMPEKDHDDILIYEPRLKVMKRFLKTECVLITQIIEENSQNTDLDAIAILEKASEAVMRLGITHSARDCWIYWSQMGRKQSVIARDWPPESEDVDEEVMAFDRIRRAPDAVMLLTVPATKASELLPKEQKEHLYEVIKMMESSQYGMPVETFWSKVEEAMKQAGYVDGRHKQREYWEEDGRQEFAYDERPRFIRRIQKTTTKQTGFTIPKSPANRIRLSARRNNLRPGVMSADFSIQENKSKKRRSDSDEYQPKRGQKPQTATDMVTYQKSRYREKDYTAKNADDHPLELIIPSTGEKFTSYNRVPEYPEPSASPSLPNGPFLFEAAQQIGLPALPAPTSPISERPVKRARLSIEQAPDRESTPIWDTAEEILGLFGPETPQRRNSADSQNVTDYNSDENSMSVPNSRTRRPVITMRREEPAVVPSDTGAIGFRSSKTPSLIEDDSTVSDETIDVPQRPQTISTNSNISATPTLIADNPATSDEQMVGNSHPSQSTPTDGIETDDTILKAILQKKLEQANSEISNLQTNLLESRGEKADTEKRIVVVDSDIENLIMMRDALRKSQADNMTEIERLEEEIKEKEGSKEEFEEGMTKVLNRASK
ncbi:5e676f6e-c437-4f1c-96c7-335600df86e4 [Sclerotinia trifoliorum]|uniref:5e676f6e-c437-4f1c-96c7-335600df86e4 n=1 Tax=Sclerotinia trifoliorum TaxID=28548 RepID=A0A8H2VRC2_9HELO|nr:5e676f6e-c437-4f1c-96c7-335600df86e4 [Sclerotinia trifoliorum]